MPIDEKVYIVMACDDVEGEDDFERLFEAHAAAPEHRNDHRRLQIMSPVCSDPRSLHEELVGLYDNSLRMPDVILLDDHMNGPKDRFDYVGLDMMNWIRQDFESFGEKLPLVLLYTPTSHIEVLDLYTFQRLGGANVVDKHRPRSRQVDAIWDTIRGVRWKHEGVWPFLKFGVWEREILPAMEADLGHDDTVEWLASQPIHPRPRAGGDPIETVRRAVNTARSALGRNDALNEHARKIQHDWPGLARGGSQRTLALAAVRSGELFIPLRHRHFFEDREPELA